MYEAVREDYSEDYGEYIDTSLGLFLNKEPAEKHMQVEAEEWIDLCMEKDTTGLIYPHTDGYTYVNIYYEDETFDPDNLPWARFKVFERTVYE